jgi:hypothetical protein
LGSRETLVPVKWARHVRLIYDASAFADSQRQADFENEVRAQVEQAKGRLSLTVTGRPQSF